MCSAPKLYSQFESNKKLILTGHDAPTTQHYLDSWQGYGKLPFDGFEVILESDEAGTKACEHPHPCRLAFSATHWEVDWFADSIDRLKSANLQLKRETFIPVNCNPGDVDWFDEAGWQEIVDHFRIVAVAVKKSGSTGIIFDPEPYPSDKLNIAFAYARQRQRAKHSFAEYQEMARQRGRQCMRAMASECPDLKVLSYFFLSYVTSAVVDRGPNLLEADSESAGMQVHQYNLLIPFLWGWLDAAPPTVRLIDGDENSYDYTSELEYQATADRVLRKGLVFVPAELQAKYRAQVSIGSAVFLDNCQTQNGLYQPIGSLSPIQILEHRLQWALRSTEEYVWLYAESGRFLTFENDAQSKSLNAPHRSDHKQWNEIFPEAINAIARIRDSTSQADWLNRQLQFELKSNRATPLFEHESVGKETNGMRSWMAWQPDWSIGTLNWTPVGEMFEIAGAANAVLVRDVAVQTGQTIHVRAQVAVEGQGHPFLMVAWLNSDKELLPKIRFTPVTDSLIDEKSKQVELHGRWQVSDGCHFARVMIGAASQGDISDIIKVNDAQVFRITTN